MKNRISEDAAIELLKRIYTSAREDDDYVSREQIYEGAQREQYDEKTNRNWLNTVMAKLRDHELIVPVYKFDGRKKLTGVRLAVNGRRALGMTVAEVSAGSASLQQAGMLTETLPVIQTRPALDLTLDELLTVVEALSRKHTSFDITLTIKPKGGIYGDQGVVVSSE